MTYEIVYSDCEFECSSAVAPPAVQVTVPVTSTVVDVMEQAIVDNGNDYAFTATYKTYSWGHGFFLDELNSTANKKGDSFDCYWLLYLDDKSSSYGMSDAKIECVSTVSWRYKKTLKS